MLNLEIFCNILLCYIDEINNAENYNTIGRCISELNIKDKSEVFEILNSEILINTNFIKNHYKCEARTSMW